MKWASLEEYDEYWEGRINDLWELWYEMHPDYERR